MKINRQLIEKYNKPIPRYTSYPPANFFSEQFTSDDYLQAIKASNNHDPSNISIYIHIPFCKKMCFYCGCNSCPMAKEKEVDDYIKALKEEIKLVLPHIHNSRKISQIHLGGGTPNSISVGYLQEINELLMHSFSLTDKPEIAIECHPGYLDEAYINGLRKAGFNRFSLGIQDFSRKVLKAVNREPSILPMAELTSLLREVNHAGINFDFIYGLPYQSKESFVQTIHEAILLEPDRLVTFSYAHVPWVNKAQLVLERKGLPTAEQKIDMTEAAFNVLESNGYRSIGMDHYVRETDDLFVAQEQNKLHRNFQGYCTRETTGQVYAFGVSGISQLHGYYFQNTKSIKAYTESIKSKKLPVIKGYQLTDRELLIKNTITRFMCNKQLHLSSITDSIPVDNKILQTFVDEGILTIENNILRITENGLPFIRNVAAVFDPLLRNSAKTFSKAV
jgi:oxygen-independent coproporphyrinogen-3 oxidase